MLLISAAMVLFALGLIVGAFLPHKEQLRVLFLSLPLHVKHRARRLRYKYWKKHHLQRRVETLEDGTTRTVTTFPLPHYKTYTSRRKNRRLNTKHGALDPSVVAAKTPKLSPDQPVQADESTEEEEDTQEDVP